MKSIAAPIVGGLITSTIHVLILVPFFPKPLLQEKYSSQTHNSVRKLVATLLSLALPLCYFGAILEGRTN